MATTRLFVYGTLRYPYIQQALYGHAKKTTLAKIYNYYKVGLNIVEKIGGEVEGEIYEVDDKELARTDQYETGAYKKIKVKTTNGKAIAYQLKKYF